MDVQFGFDNAAMLRFLGERASALKSANFEKADKIVKEMTEYKNNPENFDKIMRPNCAYVTFKKDRAFQETLKLSKDKETSLTYHGETLKIKRALQPTNILLDLKL